MSGAARIARVTRSMARKPARSTPKSVLMTTCETPEALERLRGPLSPGLAYGQELQAHWDPKGDPERFVYHGVLEVAVARVDGKVAGWGELLVSRPIPGENANSLAFCRVSRLDVAPAFRRRKFTDPRSGKPLSVLLLRALLAATPAGAEVVAEVTPDAENLFEEAGFKLGASGRWLYLGA